MIRLGDRFVYLISAEHHSAFQWSQPNNLLEFSTAMKLSSLSKIVRTIGLVAVLSATVGSSISQTVQAQTEPVTLEERVNQWRADDIARWETCDGVYQQEAEIFEGNYFFDPFRKLNLTEEQNNAYLTFNAQSDAETLEVLDSSLSVVDPTAALSFSYSVDPDQLPESINSAIQAALNENPTSNQLEALNQEFGQYGEFSGAYINYLRPDQKAQLAQITENFQAQMQSVMTPEQVIQYQENLASGRRISAACDSPHPVYASYPAMGRLVDSIPELLQ